MKNNSPIYLFILLALFFSATEANAQAIPVTVAQDESGVWHMSRNGKEYDVRGAGGNVQLDKLVEIGGNSIRTWSTDNAQEILDEAYSKGLTVMLGLWVQHERHGFDYNDEKKLLRNWKDLKKLSFNTKTTPLC